jgi:hypothetical protein
MKKKDNLNDKKLVSVIINGARLRYALSKPILASLDFKFMSSSQSSDKGSNESREKKKGRKFLNNNDDNCAPLNKRLNPNNTIPLTDAVESIILEDAINKFPDDDNISSIGVQIDEVLLEEQNMYPATSFSESYKNNYYQNVKDRSYMGMLSLPESQNSFIDFFSTSDVLRAFQFSANKTFDLSLLKFHSTVDFCMYFHLIRIL